ncbi:MAG: MFS transporter [Thermodesulfobacteriota bacterium]|nr:MFS transporter [Thermodesulfobacteriota bacterium]
MIKKIFYGWYIVIACFLIGFYVGGTIFYGFTAFFEPIREEFGWSYTQISFAASLRGLEMGIFAPFVGFLADRFGSRRLIFWGTIVVGFGMWSLGIPLSFIIRNRPEQYGYIPDGEVSREPVSNTKIQGKGAEVGLKEAFKTKVFIYLAFADAIRIMTVMAVVTHVYPTLTA